MKSLGKFNSLRRVSTMASVTVLAVAALAAPKMVEAATVDIFLIASQTSPSSVSTAPLTVTTSKVFQLSNLNGNGAAREATLVDNFSFNITQSLTYNNQSVPNSNPFDEGETGAGTASLFNSQLATWDDVGIHNDGADDAPLNVDFGRNNGLTLNPVEGGFTDLVIAEDAGLNPFRLDLCTDAACTAPSLIFSGFNISLRDALAAMPEFSPSDSSDASEMDQAFLFRFSDPVTDFVRVTELDDRKFYTGQRLEVDFIGVNAAPSVVPVPAGLPLLLTGFGLLGWAARRKKS